jgi:hypothetical protein
LIDDAQQSGAFGLGFQDATGTAIQEKKVIGRAGSGGRFPNRDAWAGVEVNVRTILDDPSGCGQSRINALAGSSLWRFSPAVWIVIRHCFLLTR